MTETQNQNDTKTDNQGDAPIATATHATPAGAGAPEPKPAKRPSMPGDTEPVPPDSFAGPDPYKNAADDVIPWITQAQIAYEAREKAYAAKQAARQSGQSVAADAAEVAETPDPMDNYVPLGTDNPVDFDKVDEATAYDDMPGIKTPWKTRVARWVARYRARRNERLARQDLGNVQAQKLERRRQQQHLVWLAVVAALAIGIALWAGSIVTRAPRPEPEVRLYTNDFKLGPDTLEKQSYRQTYEEKLDAMGRRLGGLEETLATLNVRLKAADKSAKAEGASETAGAVPPEYAHLPDFATSGVPGVGGTPATPPRKPDPPRLGKMTVAANPDASGGAKSRPRALWDEPLARNRARHEAANSYLPAGSFARGVVLSGVTAPTGGNAAQNPIPMLIELTDLARLPNRFQSDVQRCFVTANATGDLSSERVWVRLDRLSCMTRSGKAIDVRVQGYATGEDGKTGVRARLVSRSGQAIANALFLGTLSGLGEAVSLSAQSSTTYASGSVQTNVDNPWRAGMGEGMSDAMDRIVAYYIRLADKIFPVLELDSGRTLDIVLSQGVTIVDPVEPEGPAEEPNGAERFGAAVRQGES